jgi:hypothetical protein
VTGRTTATALLTGLAAVVIAAAGGIILATLLGLLGLASTAPRTLGTWFGGTALLGGWSQDVTASVAGGLNWSTWAAGAPMLVTLAVMWFTATMARRSGGATWVDAVAAGAGGVLGAAVLVGVSRVTTETVNQAGSVSTSSGLTWLWTGGTHPGTLVGAALLIGGTWWLNTVGLDWWCTGRSLAYGLLIVPGLVITVVAAAGVVYLTSSPAVGLATVLLFPLLGVTAILGLGGSPTSAGITRLSPEPYDLWTWNGGVLYGAGGLLLVVIIAVVVGLVLRGRKHSGGWLPGITVTAAVAGFVAWATDTAVVVPDALGGPTRLSCNPLAAMVVAALMAVIALAVRGRRPDGNPADPSTTVEYGPNGL